MRPVIVFANSPVPEIQELRRLLRGRWRVAVRAVMVLLSLHGLSPAQIAALLGYDPATVRRWIGRSAPRGWRGWLTGPGAGGPGWAGPGWARADRRPARPSRTLDGAADLALPGAATGERAHGVPAPAAGRRLAAAQADRPGDPARTAVLAAIAARLRRLPPGPVVWAADETCLQLLPHVRARWTLRGRRPQIPTPGKNRRLTVLGALEMTTGRWVYRLGRRCAADFTALLGQVVAAFRPPRRSW